jgi:hypothetical protein
MIDTGQPGYRSGAYPSSKSLQQTMTIIRPSV